ncbi:MAG: leucine-rich repeat domain-containing protein [Clostridiales bacterium]|nr:leucine-rich repeat domain-containing protein [Clostridiales bacterium]
MIDLVEMKCKYCGGQLTLLDDKRAHCEYCGKEYMIDTGSPENVYNVYSSPKENNTPIVGIVIAAAAFLAVMLLIIFSFSAYRARTRTFSPSPVISEIPESEEMVSFSPLFDCMLQDAFGKSGVEVTEEQLASIRFFSLQSDMDNTALYYSTSLPNADGELPADIHTLTVTGLEYDFADLSRLKGLVSIDLGRRSLYKPLTELNDLTMLSVGNNLEELTEYVDPAKITHLSLNGSTTDLTGIDAYTSLTSLSVDSSDLTDIGALSAAKGLTALSLSDCESLKDYDVLYTLTGLESLSLEDTSVKEIGFVAQMPKLTSFILDDSEVLDLSPLTGLTGLTSLTLSDCSEASDFSAVSTLNGLTALTLSLYSTQEMPDLSGLSYLECLSVNGADSIAFLSELPQLKELSLYGCDVSHYEVFQNLTSLESLSLKSFWGTIPDLSFLRQIPHLKNLDLSGNEFYGSIHDAFCLPELERLNLSDCSFELKTGNLVPCETLTVLNLNRVTLYTNVSVWYDGPITNVDYDKVSLSDTIGFLANYPNLKELSIAGNKLSDLSFTESLPLLETLDIRENYITDLRPLDKLTHLKTVCCADNAVSKYPASEKILIIE